MWVYITQKGELGGSSSYTLVQQSRTNPKNKEIRILSKKLHVDYRPDLEDKGFPDILSITPQSFGFSFNI